MTTADGDDEGGLEISVVEVRGKKRVGFSGIDYLHVDEETEDQLLQRYEDIILALDDLADQYEDGPDRAWHIGRVLEEYDVSENSDITIADIARYNSIGVNERRMSYCREIYRFFRDQNYDPSHNVTALGELASRAKGQDRENEARTGYEKIRDAGVDLTRRDIFAWWELDDDSPLDEIVKEVVSQYEKPKNIVSSIRRVLILLGEDPEEYSADQIRSSVKRHLEARHRGES